MCLKNKNLQQFYPLKFGKMPKFFCVLKGNFLWNGFGQVYEVSAIYLPVIQLKLGQKIGTEEKSVKENEMISWGK